MTLPVYHIGDFWPTLLDRVSSVHWGLQVHTAAWTLSGLWPLQHPVAMVWPSSCGTDGLTFDSGVLWYTEELMINSTTERCRGPVEVCSEQHFQSASYLLVFLILLYCHTDIKMYMNMNIWRYDLRWICCRAHPGKTVATRLNAPLNQTSGGHTCYWSDNQVHLICSIWLLVSQGVFIYWQGLTPS